MKNKKYVKNIFIVLLSIIITAICIICPQYLINYKITKNENKILTVNTGSNYESVVITKDENDFYYKILLLQDKIPSEKTEVNYLNRNMAQLRHDICD